MKANNSLTSVLSYHISSIWLLNIDIIPHRNWPNIVDGEGYLIILSICEPYLITLCVCYILSAWLWFWVVVCLQNDYATVSVSISIKYVIRLIMRIIYTKMLKINNLIHKFSTIEPHKWLMTSLGFKSNSLIFNPTYITPNIQNTRNLLNSHCQKTILIKLSKNIRCQLQWSILRIFET